MNHQYLDPALMPLDDDSYDGDKEERLLESIAKSYHPDQVFEYWQLHNWATKEGYILPDGGLTKNKTTKDY